jgi:hypothetical protein
MPRVIRGRVICVGHRALVPAAARSNLVRDAAPLRSETTLWTGQQAGSFIVSTDRAGDI